MTKAQREYFVQTIKKKFDVDVEFYPKHPKGYGLTFNTQVEDSLKENILKFYETVSKNR